MIIFAYRKMMAGGSLTLYSKLKFISGPEIFNYPMADIGITCEVVAKCLAPLHSTSQLDVEDRPR